MQPLHIFMYNTKKRNIFDIKKNEIDKYFCILKVCIFKIGLSSDKVISNATDATC